MTTSGTVRSARRVPRHHIVQEIDGSDDFGEDLPATFADDGRRTPHGIAIQVKGGRPGRPPGAGRPESRPGRRPAGPAISTAPPRCRTLGSTDGREAEDR
ncbi:hypothetical protein [Kitasatospora sp. NPDC091207]|uniref:hypothetical protein n=1 Tax=Kitasatospora sp. NPDC091207 TaxID=3364083 RepID=UPI0038256478